MKSTTSARSQTVLPSRGRFDEGIAARLTGLARLSHQILLRLRNPEPGLAIESKRAVTTHTPNPQPPIPNPQSLIPTHQPPTPNPQPLLTNHGFTLIEMLVSLVITLIMMGAVVSLFGLVTDTVSGSRSMIEMSERLRSCRNRLQADLQGITVTMQPPRRPENDEGYFELIEGPDRDTTHLTTGPSIFGDTDDVLMFTVRSRGEPFVGKFNAQTVESQVAEVIYFTRQDGPIVDATTGTRLLTLYRRVLLVLPGQRSNLSLVPPAGFYDSYDVSMHVEGATVIPNSLGDLTKRENRFGHSITGFPFDVAAYNNTTNGTIGPMILPRVADDVLMTNVLAFDVQVFDPNAPVQLVSGVAVGPSDSGFLVAGTTTSLGAYADLGYAFTYAGGPNVPFFNTAAWKSVKNVNAPIQYLNPFLPLTGVQGPPATPSYTYDTWSWHYENDGVDQDALLGADQGTNGLDDDTAGAGFGVVDDLDEMETRPPFAAQLRGIRVIIRAYDPSSQQVRQVEVVQDFLPD